LYDYTTAKVVPTLQAHKAHHSETTVHWPRFVADSNVKTHVQTRMVSFENHTIRTSGIPTRNRTLSWIRHSGHFRVIQCHSCWCQQKRRTLCRPNVQ